MQNLIEFQAQEKNIQLKIDFQIFKHRKLYSDAYRLKQILLNLLSNALKFTNEGYIKLTIQDVTEDEQEEPTYKFIVEDTGIGIKSEDVNKLFKLFGCLETSPKINKTGIGLGLTISKMLSVNLSPKHSEGIQVESVLGHGSKFYFYLTSMNLNIHNNNNENFCEIDEKVKMILPKSKSCEFYMSTNKSISLISKSIDFIEKNETIKSNVRKILVVDDDLINIMIVEQYLKFFGIPSIRALNGQEAYNIVEKDILDQNFQISMIIMDCNMPILDGFQASEKIQKLIRETKVNAIPILAVTANSSSTIKEMCKKSGMDYYLEKPMMREDLRNMINKILS